MSNMVVQTNVLALNAHRNMKVVGTIQSKASQKLSSGYRINSAADDAAGLAISEKMRAQIRGLDMASKNSQDAISLIQTAEGGMQEIDNMVQRIRELVVYASNDTQYQDTSDKGDPGNTKASQGDRQKIQDEINNLVQEIDSMALRTEFNQKKLIDGTWNSGTQVNLPNVQSTHAGPGTKIAKSAIVATADPFIATPEKAFAELNALFGSSDYITFANPANDWTDTGGTPANDASVEFAAVGSAFAAAFAKAPADLTASDLQDIYDALDTLAMNIAGNDTNLAVGSTETDVRALANAISQIGVVNFDDDLMGALAGANFEDLSGDAANVVTSYNALAGAATAVTGPLADLLADANAGDVVTAFTNLQNLLDGAPPELTMESLKEAYDAFREALKEFRNTDSNARTLVDTFTDDSAGEFGLVETAVADRIANLEASIVPTDPVDPVTPPSTPGKTLYFQVGANANQKLEVNINSVNSAALGLGDGNTHEGGQIYIDVVRETGANINGLLDGLDAALSIITTERSKLGAYQNRLEYTIKSLDISSENLSASESRIRDTDMAKEMMKMTSTNILQQAGVSMLAQANQNPQSVLQLLR